MLRSRVAFPWAAGQTLWWIALAGLFFLATCQPVPAQQTRNCAARDVLRAHLLEAYGETTRVVGITETGMLVEIMGAEQGGTFSILITAPEGPACLIAMGRDFHVLEALAPLINPEGDPL